MIPALTTRGFGWGSGMTDPTGERFIINIPKNASSYIHDWAKQQGWRATTADNETQVKEMIVILRDPVDRWISGIAQYIVTYVLNVYGFNGPVYPHEPITDHDRAISAQEFLDFYNPAVERLIFDILSRFDDHVWPQNEIIDGVLTGVPKKFFRMDDIDIGLCTYLRWSPSHEIARNSGRSNDDTRMLQEFFYHRLYSARPELLDRVKKHYHKDYQLFSNLA